MRNGDEPGVPVAVEQDLEAVIERHVHTVACAYVVSHHNLPIAADVLAERLAAQQGTTLDGGERRWAVDALCVDAAVRDGDG